MYNVYASDFSLKHIHGSSLVTLNECRCDQYRCYTNTHSELCCVVNALISNYTKT